MTFQFCGDKMKRKVREVKLYIMQNLTNPWEIFLPNIDFSISSFKTSNSYR